MSSDYNFDSPFEMTDLLNSFVAQRIDSLNEQEIDDLFKNLTNRESSIFQILNEIRENHWNPAQLHLRDNMSLSKLHRHDNELIKRENGYISEIIEIRAQRSLINQKLEFEKIFANKVLHFSLLTILLGGDQLEMLLVPPATAAMYAFSVPMLSTDTPVGSEALFKNVGYTGHYVAPNGRKIELTIISTKACPRSILTSIREATDYSTPTPTVLPRSNGGERRRQQLRPY